MFRVGTSILTLLLVWCGVVGAQQVGGGSIVLSPVMTIGGESGVLVSPSYNVVRGGRRLYIAASSLPPHEISVFDLDGTLRGTFGRRGQGPGEFQWIRALGASRQDTLHVFDVLNSRHTVLSPELELVRSARLAGEVLEGPVLFFEDGSFLLNAVVSTPDRVGFPLHLHSPDGDLVHSFGSEVPRRALGQGAGAFRRLLAPANDGGIWVAHTREYVLEHWTRTGDLLHRVRLDAGWLRTEVPDPRFDGEVLPPLPSLLSIREDADGLLWVVGRTPAPGWQSALDAQISPDVIPLVELVLEVVHPREGRILASTRVSSFAGAFVGGDEMLYTYRESDMGLPMFDFWRVTLSPRPADSR